VVSWIRPAGSSEVAERASHALLACRRTAVPRWSARVSRDALPTLSPPCPAANECQSHQSVMYTDSPAALRYIIAPFQPSALSGPEAPSTTSVTAKGDQTMSVSQLYCLPRAPPMQCGAAKLDYDAWNARGRLGSVYDVRSPRRAMTARFVSWLPPSHRGARRVCTGHALHWLQALPRWK